MTMNCRRLRELIDEYILGSLSSKLRREIDEHLASCNDCKRELEDARALHEALKSPKEPIEDSEWAAVESRTLARLRTEMAAPAHEGLLSKLAEFFTPVFRPQPRLVLALASTLVVVFVLALSLVWLQSSREQLASGDSIIHRLWTDDGEATRQSDDSLAALMTGVEAILAEQNGEDLYESDVDSTLDVIAQESDLSEMDPDVIDSQMRHYYDVWAVNGGYYSDILDASDEEMKSAIQAVFDGTENGS